MIFDENNEFKGVDGFVFDNTELVKLQEQANLSNRMESANTLASGIAHDFNNLFSVMYGSLELLEEDYKFSEDSQELITELNQSLEVAMGLVKHFSLLSKGVHLESKVINVYDSLNKILKITSSKIKTELNCEKDTYFINVNESAFDQVALNIILNSVDALTVKGIDETSKITLSVDMCGYYGTCEDLNYMRLRFQDTGCGIADNKLPQIFDPLYSTKTDYSTKGLGLGLAIVYTHVTSRFNGHIDVSSEVGKGTTVDVYIPKVELKDKL